MATFIGLLLAGIICLSAGFKAPDKKVRDFLIPASLFILLVGALGIIKSLYTIFNQ